MVSFWTEIGVNYLFISPLNVRRGMVLLKLLLLLVLVLVEEGVGVIVVEVNAVVSLSIA